MGWVMQPWLNSQVKAIILGLQNVTVFRDKAFTEIIKVKMRLVA